MELSGMPTETQACIDRRLTASDRHGSRKCRQVDTQARHCHCIRVSRFAQVEGFDTPVT